MRVIGVLLVGVACGGDVPDRPVTLEAVVDIPFLVPQLATAFDADNAFVVMDGNSLARLREDRLEPVPNSFEFAQGVIGVDRDGSLLLSSHLTGALARFGTAIEAFVPSPGLPASSVVGAASGSYYLTSQFDGTALTWKLGDPGWTATSHRHFGRTLRAADGTLYAIHDGDVHRIAADDTPEVLVSCTDFGGAQCDGAELAGFDARGRIMIARVGAPAVGFLDPASGVLDAIDLPGDLVVFEGRASALGSVIAVRDDERDERSLWFLPPDGDAFRRALTLPAFDGGELRLLADRAGELYLAGNGTLSRVVPE